MKALIRVSQSGGTFVAVGKIGLGGSMRASCTMGRKEAATRCAEKLFCLPSERLLLKPVADGDYVFWAEEAAQAS